MNHQQTKPNIIYPILVALFLIFLLGATLIRAGLPYFVIFGAAALISYGAWLLTTYKRPADPQTILPLYLLALAVQVIHTVEEYIMDFPGEITTLFNSPPVGRDVFAVAVMGGFAAMWILTALGLIYKNPFANYLLWFFLVGPGVINSVAHFSFPFLGHSHYFPGLITLILPTIMSIVVIRALILGRRRTG